MTVACKPTEANYRSAYEAALGKRRQVDPDAEILYGGHTLMSSIGAIPESEGVDTVMVLRIPVKVIEGDSLLRSNRYRVAIGMYKMGANAKAQSARLATPGSGVVASGEEQYFTIVSSFARPDDARRGAAEYYRRHPEGPYIGLDPSKPVVLYSPR